jgi:hypothetical protein
VVRGAFVKNQQNRQLGTYGWANGYLILSNDHPYYGKDYDDINNNIEIYVHGGWTFSSHLNKFKNVELKMLDGDNINFEDDLWVIGFDTKHFDDDLEKWPREKVLVHIKQLENYFNRIENFI